MGRSGFDHNIILKACNRAAVAFDHKNGITSVNYTFEAMFKWKPLAELEKIFQSSFDREDPTLYPFELSGKSHIIVVLPMIHSKKEDTRLAFILPRESCSSFNRIELDKDSYHHINNPLAIIYMQFIVPKKKVTLDQDQVDKIYEKLRESFKRIEDYIQEVINENCQR